MKYQKVLEKVYDPGRLCTTWQQVKKNAGAFGIDSREWVSYYRIQAFRYLFRALDAWIRSRLKSIQLKK